MRPYRPFIKQDDKRLKINGFIRAPRVQVIDENGQQLGEMNTFEAIKLAQGKELDLVEVGPQAIPPVCKIMDHGKYLYQKEKKEKANKSQKSKTPEQEIKVIQLGFKTSPHDMAIRLDQIDKFLQKGYRVKIDLRLRGREKGLADVAKQKIADFLSYIQIPYLSDMPLKQSPNGFNIIIKADPKQQK